jgi:hypothetical protein
MTSAVGAWRLWLVAVAIGLVAVMVAGIAALAASTATAPPAALTSCWELFVPLFTWRSVAALALGATGSVVLLAAVASVGRQLWGSRYYARRHEIEEELVFDGERVRLVADPRPLAFTLGLIRPSIYVSAGARERMTVEQLRAVVAHEAHHRRRRDPLRLMATRAFATALFFVPACRTLAANHARLVEIDADHAAVAITGKKALAGALLLFADSRQVGGASIGVERVDALAGDRRRFAFPLALLAAGLAASLTIAAIGFLMGLAAPDRDGAHLPGVVEQACILARALLPLGVGALVLALVGARNRRAPTGVG